MNLHNMNSDISSPIWLEYIAYGFLGVAARVLPISCMITLMYDGITLMFLSMSSLWLYILIIMYDTLKDIKSIEAQPFRLRGIALVIDVIITLSFSIAIIDKREPEVILIIFVAFVIPTILNVIDSKSKEI